MSSEIRNAVPHVDISQAALDRLDYDKNHVVDQKELDRGILEDKVVFSKISKQFVARPQLDLLPAKTSQVMEAFGYVQVPKDTLQGKPLKAVTHNVWAKPSPFRTEYVEKESGVKACNWFQIQYDPEACGLATTEGRMRREAKAITEMGAHLMTVQEAFSGDTKPLENAFPFSYRPPSLSAWQGIKQGKFTGSGLAILSRFPILKTDFEAFKQGEGSDDWANKGVAFARVYVPGMGPVNVFNTHTEAGWGTEQTNVRFSQLQQIKNFVAKHGEGLPTLIMGDFNFVPGTPEYKHVTEALNWRDLFHETHPQQAGHTYVPENPHNDDDESPERLDYVFAVGPWKVDQIGLVMNKPVDEVVTSDHYGIKSEVRLAK